VRDCEVARLVVLASRLTIEAGGDNSISTESLSEVMYRAETVGVHPGASGRRGCAARGLEL
jgi:hypothetical protein